MPDLAKVALIALALLAGLGLVVGLTLRRHIGGFIESVAREEREREEAEAAEAARNDGAPVRKEDSTGA